MPMNSTNISPSAQESNLILVTGATGLVGSNTALLARERGLRVRALVRTTRNLEPLTSRNIEIAQGDVTDPASLDRAMRGVTGVIHSAALLGGTWSNHAADAFWQVNHQGTMNVLDAARKAGVAKCVVIDTHAIHDPSSTHTERSPVVLMEEPDSPYLCSKRAAHYGTLYRASLGQHICLVTPGEIYGPSVFVQRAQDPTTFTSTLLKGIRGEIDQFVGFPMFWTFAPDVAEICLRALERGKRGRCYLAMGNDEDAGSLADFCNQGAALAGSPHRVKELKLDDKDAPEMGTLRRYAERIYAKPYVDNRLTTEALGFSPTPRAHGLARTIVWARASGLLA
jgi:dihydroflavonol-4-reductase